MPIGKEMEEKEIKDYYSQEDLVERILEVSKYREVVPTYPESYGKRPDAVNFPGDFNHFIDQGAIAFHGSVEIWRNPLLIDSVDNLDNLRTSWDLVIDIDCDENFDYSRKAALLLLEALREHGVKPGVKFSGNRGFHVGVSREAFPEKVKGKEISLWYPELPQYIVQYLKEYIKKDLRREIGKKPYSNLDVESNWGDRHLFRLPYSLNEKSWLVSLPLSPEEVEGFEKRDAEPEKVEVEERFLKKQEGKSKDILAQALDYGARQKKKRKKRKKKSRKNYKTPEKALPREVFPPCIQHILNGLEDGRKRSLFILLNFLKNTGYDWDSIENMVWDWNSRNKEELRENYIESQLNWHKNQEEAIAPPNCDADGYYLDIPVKEPEKPEDKICDPDNLCKKISNPLSYAFRKLKAQKGSNNDKKDSKGKKESEKEDSDQGKGILECPYCGKRYKSKKWYKKHVQECFEE